MLDIAPARYQYRTSPGPCVVSLATKPAVVAILDGSGSWGTGVEAAAWALDQLADTWSSTPPATAMALAADLLATATAIPGDRRDSEFGFGFCVAALVVDGHWVNGWAAGLYAIAACDESGWTSLYEPPMLIDLLLREGKATSDELAQAHVPAVYAGKLLGEHADALMPIPSFRWERDTVIIAHREVVAWLRAMDDGAAFLKRSARDLQDEVIGAGLKPGPIVLVRNDGSLV